MAITEEHVKHIEKRIERGYDLDTDLEKEQAMSDIESLYEYALHMKRQQKFLAKVAYGIELTESESKEADKLVKDFITI